ncbi:uncharacterized protein [Miscanthus floridulus]|uniref:uncharacterized protein n=1 Tax=Miscanthus floridulus TaxID=154761 RepID=UPI003458AC52
MDNCKTEASSSATQYSIYKLSPILFNNIPLKYPYICSYKWETPTLRHHLPQMLQLPPIEAAGKLYKVDQICNLPNSSFQGGATYSCIAKITAIITTTKWYYKACRRSIDAIAFSSIAEDLVERTASKTSQNMKIDAADQAVSLETAIGKTRLFYIGMSPDSSSNFSNMSCARVFK